MRAGILTLIAGGIAVFGLVAVADGATKRQIIDRAAEICANGDRAMQPYDDRAERAAKRGDRTAVIRNARVSLRIGRRYLARLADLRPPRQNRRHYRDFIEHTQTMTNWLDGGLDALAARRYRRSARRFREAERSSARAKAAARRYPLRRACIRYVNLD
jgi:hypothetical protein